MNPVKNLAEISPPKCPAGVVQSSRAPVVLAWLVFAWLTLLLLFSYWPVLVPLARQWWTDPDVSHGLFAPIVSGYAVWVLRPKLEALPAQPSLVGIFVMTWSALQYVVGDLAASAFWPRTALLGSLVGIVLLTRGWRTLRALTFPLFLLLFMIPLPFQAYKRFTFQLQLLASRLAETLLDWLGYSVLREGNILELVGQRLQVAQACSGLRSLFTILFFSVIYVYFLESRTSVRLLLVALSIPIAILANSGRIVISAIMGRHDPRWIEGAAHATTGWVLAGLVILILIAIHAGINRFPSMGLRLQKTGSHK
jgi:exosortase